MSYYDKLKPDRSVVGLLPAFFTLAVGAVLGAIFGRNGVAWFFTMAFLAFTLLAFTAWLRTRAVGYLGSTTYLLTVTLALASVPGSLFGMDDRSLYRVFVTLTFPVIVWLIYLMFARKAKWRGRDLLELAAAPVIELGNGFTERPRPSGKIDRPKEDIIDFAEYCRRNLIALPRLDSDRVYFVLVRMGREFGYLWNPGRDISRDSWVCFDFDGQVSVNISRKDYHMYKDDLEFDKLCASLAETFIEFLEMFVNRQEVRIIDRLNETRTGILS